MTADEDTRALPLLDRRPALVPGLVVAFICLVGILNMPYSYYDFLRAAVCTGALTIASISLAAEIWWWVIVAIGMLAIWAPVGRTFFNPTQSGWALADFIAAVLFVIAAATIPRMSPKLDSLGKPSKFQTWWFYSIVCVAVVVITIFAAANQSPAIGQ